MLCPAVFPGKSGTGASFEKSLPSPICPPAWAAAALSYSAVVALADPSLSRHSLTHAGQSALPDRLPRCLHRQEHMEPIIRQAAEPKPGVERSRCVSLGIHLAGEIGDGSEFRLHPRLRLLTFCLMPNHWHLVLWPQADGDLSRFMHRLTMTHTMRWHHAHGTLGTGPLHQGRFKSFPVETGVIGSRPRLALWEVSWGDGKPTV